MNRRVVVTGMGVVSPIGNNLEEFRTHLKEGRPGDGPIQSFQWENSRGEFPVKKVFEVKNFEPRRYGTHLLDPFIQYAIAATTEAVEHAGFDPYQVNPYRIGISVSSSKGGVHTIDRFKERFERNPSAILGARIYANSVPNYAAQWIARRWKIEGPAKCYVAACATGTVAVGEGARMVSEGTVDYCIAGASDASITPLMLAGYHNMKALAKSEMLPFDSRRSGFLVGEGAGILFLETLESAKARGAPIYGEILGTAYGADTGDALRFDRKDDALARVIKLVMERQQITAEEIDYINLHGTATNHGDVYETEQIKKCFGKKAGTMSMSSTKSMTGHMLGAAGAVEIIACLVAMQDGFVPPTARLEKPDPACDLNYTPLHAAPKKIETCLSLSMGFGGHIAVIAVRTV